jgi:outer membrane protein assembly factor BamB
MVLRPAGLQKTAALLSALLAMSAGATAFAAEVPSGSRERPFRMGYLSLNAAYDQAKPLAMSDAGFVVNSALLIGSFNEHWVGGLSIATGKPQWWFDGKVSMTAPPGSFGSSVMLGFRDGRVVKLDALTGKRQWVANLDSFTERPFLLSGTTLFVVTAAQVLHAIDFQTGKVHWLFDGGFPDGLTVAGGARPIIHDGKILFGVASGEIVAVDAETGKLAWRYNPAYNDQKFHSVVGEITVRNNRLLMTRYDGLVAAIDLASSVRATAWQEMMPGLSTSTFRNGRYYIGGIGGEVVAIDPDNGGRQVWRTVTGASVVSIVAGETTLYVGGSEGRVTALDASSGEILWHDKLGTAIFGPPALFESSIFYSTGLKSIYAYKLK